METLDLFGVMNKDTIFAIGVVEDNVDPLGIGRVKARYFKYHPNDRSLVPTKDLPWSQVLQPTNSASISGIGWSPNGLERGSWVFAIFLDGEEAQTPLILGTFASLHRPSAPDDYLGNSGAGYHNSENPYSGNPSEGPFLPKSELQPGEGATLKDDGSYLTKQNISNWPLTIYKPSPSRGDTGLACKDGNESLRIHYASALALEQLTKDVGSSGLAINSAYRTPAYNGRLSGAAKNSMHIQGRAFDISLSSIPNIKTFIQYAVKNGFVGFGLYDTFLHIDTGKGRVWNKAKADWFVTALKHAGWYAGKPGLSDVKIQPGNEDKEKTPESQDLNSQVKDEKIPKAEPSSKKEVASYIEKRMKEQGYSPAATAAVLAHAQSESGFNPGAFNPNDVGKSSAGLFQWRGSRQDGLNSFASERGLNPGLASTQMDYFFHELSTTHASEGAGLKSATSADSANAVMSSFERFRGWNGGPEYFKRLAGTKRFLNEGTEGVSTNSIDQGFRDPTGSLPYGNYKGKPSTNSSALGVNGNLFQPNIASTNSGKVGSFPVAGDTGTITEPDMGQAPQYPYNKTYSSKGGHLFEFDDTPASERINLQHKSGSRFEVSAKGTTLLKSYGNAYRVDLNSSFHMVNGNYYVAVKDDYKLKITGDTIQDTDGSLEILVGNDYSETVSGDRDINVGGVLRIKASKIILESDSSIDALGHTSITIEGGNSISLGTKSLGMKSESTTLDTSGEVSLKGSTVHMDDVIRAAEGSTKSIEKVEAASADLGKAPKRKTIEKSYEPKTNPDAIPSSEDSYNVYSRDI